MNLNAYLTPYTKSVEHYLNIKAKTAKLLEELKKKKKNILMTMERSKDFLRKTQKHYP